MNPFDIIVYVALAWALVSGWWRGLAVQLLSLAGVVAALFVAAAYGRSLGELLGLDDSVAGVTGFIIIFLAVLVAVGVAARLLRTVFRFAGLGALDALLGVVFSVAKVLLVLSVLFAWFDALNADYDLVGRQTIDDSHWFRPVAGISESLTPYFEELKQKITEKYVLPDIGRLKKELPRQQEMYEKASGQQLEEAFSQGVCFNQQIQQQIIEDDNLLVMEVFAKYWDLVPDMRKFMIRKGSLELNALYLSKRSLGKQCIELVKNTRFTPDFLRENFGNFTKEAQVHCINIRKINL